MKQLVYGSPEAVELWKLLSTREAKGAGEGVAEFETYTLLSFLATSCVQP